MNPKILIILIFLIGLGTGGFFIFNQKNNNIKDIGNALEKQDLIKLDTPKPNEVIQSPLAIEGEARGYWFFEASFPAKLLDEKGKELGRAIVQAQSDWMTENFVRFRATLEFQKSTTGKGTLILEKDNPSGLPENADWLEIPVNFSK